MVLVLRSGIVLVCWSACAREDRERGEERGGVGGLEREAQRGRGGERKRGRGGQRERERERE